MTNPMFRVLMLFVGLSLSLSLMGQRKAMLLEHRDRIQISLVKMLNSRYRETNLCITPDGKYLYFMSLRGGQPWSRSFMEYRGQPVFDGDIWYSEKRNGLWQRPKCLPYGINTGSGEDEPNVSPDGTTVFYQSWNDFWERTEGPYYEVSFDRNTGEWGRGKGLGGGIFDFFQSQPRMRATDGMSVSPDGRRFIVACGTGYDAPMDIYISEKGRLGWGYLKRLSISTEGDERSVFLAADGRTLYFASDGYEGFGGLDIYKAIINDDGTMGEVINLGKPFNTPADDYGFILSGDGSEGYFVRDGDIYFADLTEADPRIRPGIEINLYGTVQDSATGVGIQAEIILLDAYTKRPVKRIQTDARGQYRTTLPNENAMLDEVVVANNYDQKTRRLRIRKRTYADNYEVNFFLGRKVQAPIAAARPEKRPDPERVPEPAPKPKKELPSLGGVDAPRASTLEGENTGISDISQVDNPYNFDGIAYNNLTLLIDVSASMKQSGRLPLLKEAFVRMTLNMRKEDRITIMAYSDNVEVVAEGVSAIQQDLIEEAIDQLSAGGGTQGKSALRKAYRLAEEHFIPSGNNRIILATDGIFDLGSLTKVASSFEDKIKLSVFSFGKIGDERREMFESIARAGGGMHTNITRENIDFALLKEAKAVRAKR